jgi:uncharacterized membrane protein HdeD (DUF308 family)
MSTQAGPPERGARGASGSGGTRLPAVARYWWLTALRGLVALLLALALAVAGRSTARLVSFLALFWLTGGLLTLRFALAIRPRPGFRLGLAAAIAAVVGAGLVLLRDRLSGLVDPEVFVGLLGVAAVLTGLLRILGGFAAEERLGRRWTLGGVVLGTLEVGLGALLLLTSGVDPDLLAPIVAAWGAVSGTLLLIQGLQLRRLARTWRQASGTPPQDP